MEVSKLKENLVGKHISITVDETTDNCGRNVANILFSYENQTKLVKTHFLETVTYRTISKIVIDTIYFYNISYDNIILLITDNASYMIKAFKDILSPLIPTLYHNTCLAHVFNLVGETWVKFEKFNLLSQVVSNIKTIFSYSAARKRRWLLHLTSNISNSSNPVKVTIPPLPVKTRWNSWFKFVIWMSSYIQYFKSFFEEEKKLDKKNNAIKELVTIFQQDDQVFFLEILILFIKFNASR